MDARDTEIDRLTGMLEGGRPYDVVALEARNRSNERLISHLNIQVFIVFFMSLLVFYFHQLDIKLSILYLIAPVTYSVKKCGNFKVKIKSMSSS